jgi:signal transduction histidine kinase
MVEGRVVGVLNVESPQEDAFTEYDELLLMTLAGQAATAIKHAEDLERDRQEALWERSGDIVHRLSNPTGAILWRIERLREKNADLFSNDDYLARSVADIERNVLRIQGMTTELQEGASEPLAPLDVWSLLTSALERVEIPENIKVATQRVDQLPPVLASRKLADVFYNLITNALEAMPEGGRLGIGAAAEDQQWVEVSVRDTGRGIPPGLQDEVFTPYFTTKEEQGHGLGLWWSKTFVERCRGTITVNSKVGEGSCFTVRLRVAP